jgi:hypothetical protein
MFKRSNEFRQALYRMYDSMPRIEENKKQIEQIRQAYGVTFSNFNNDYGVKRYKEEIHKMKIHMAQIFKTEIIEHIEKDKKMILSIVENIIFLNNFKNGMGEYIYSKDYFGKSLIRVDEDLNYEKHKIEIILGRPVFSIKEIEILYDFLNENI